MPYRVYIKKDYKGSVHWEPDRPWRRRAALATALVLAAALGRELMIAPGEPEAAQWAKPMSTAAMLPADTREDAPPPLQQAHLSLPDPLPQKNTPLPTTAAKKPALEPEWSVVEVGAGESLSLIFDRLGLAPTILDAVMNAGTPAQRLKRLYPGQRLQFQIREGELLGLRFEPSITELLEILPGPQGFSARVSERQLEPRQAHASAEIKSSLFLAGQRAGLSDAMIMELAGIYGWEIDFVLDIRSGDAFRVVYEERFLDGKKVEDGPILAAEFTNQGHAYRAVRYTLPDGSTSYYSDSGTSMRKAFLRSPLDFTRISSTFDLRRRHPILNTIRAHKGVDYAAPSGTPVKATGDGIIDFVGTNGGYGRTVVVRHGSTYKTLYAHLSRYASDLKKGSRVRQGSVIGYVGSTGLATGPHLHYEFQVNGAHRNPLTVPLPRAEGIPSSEMARFQAETAAVLAALDGERPADATRLALRGGVHAASP